MEKKVSNGKAAFAPVLSLKVVAPAVEFYKKAFAVEEVLIVKNDDGSVHVAELAFEGITFHLHEEMPGSGKERAPQTVGATTVELGVFLEDPDRLMDSALAAGGRLRNPMKDYEYGYRQGSFEDPFGHHWTLQKKLNNAWEGVIGPNGEKEG
ncbi:MAG TPA: VOC family protein [Puia sp.]|jgi:PhnB protein|nr:VOC family protein [Puia sp.]